MSRGTLSRSLTRVSRKLIKQFGDAVEGRRKVVTRAADNSAKHEWRKITGFEETFPAVLTRMTESDRRRVWGAEIEASMVALVPLEVGMVKGDILCPTEGSFAGVPFEVVDRAPNDYGGLSELALNQATPRPDYGF